MLGPTMQLAHQLSLAYDEIRQQSDALETFTQGRTDPLTGVGNGRALEQQLQVLLSGAYRGNPAFAVALLSLDRDSSTPDGRSIAHISCRCCRNWQALFARACGIATLWPAMATMSSSW